MENQSGFVAVGTGMNDQRRSSYCWLALGFAISGLTAFGVLRYGSALLSFGAGALGAALMGAAQLCAMFWLIFKLETMPAAQTKLWYVGYSVLSGICLPAVLLFCTQHFLLSPFFLLAVMYGLTAAIGFWLNIDLCKAWTWGLLLVIGLALDFYLNMVWRQDRYQLIVSALSVILLIANTVYQFKQKPLDADASSSGIKAALAININILFLFVVLVLRANETKNESRD